MSQTRRDFISTGSLVGGALINLKANAKEPNDPYTGKLPILQGATTKTTTQISVLSESSLVFEMIPSYPKLTFQKIEKSYSTWKAFKIFIEDLTPGHTYQLIIKNLIGETIDVRDFSSLKDDVETARFAFASCMRDNKAEQKQMWAAMEAASPELLFLLGDNVYVDDGPTKKAPVTEEKIWRRYVETRNKLDLYKFRYLIPTLATWDDHDFGKNNTYGDRYWANYSKEVFKAMYAQDNLVPEVTWGPGIATSYEAYGQRFYMMDNRTYRHSKWFGKDHWGKSQEQWLFNHLTKNNVPSWLMNGSQFFGGYRTGWSFQGNHRKAFKKLLAKLKLIKTPVLFCSGDVHYSELMKISSKHVGYETLEITSSSMHSNARPPQPGNKRRVRSTGKFNFVIADVENTDQKLDMQIKSIGQGSKVLFELDHSILLKIKNS